MSAPTDWTKIRTEYLSKGTPYRELAEKYNVNLKTLARQAKREQWVQMRTDHVHTVSTRARQEAEDAEVEQLKKIFVSTEKLLAKANQLLDLDDPLSPRDLKALSGTLLDAKALLGIRDKRDRDEQQARIEKMRAEVKAMKDNTASENKIEVVWVNNAWDEDIDETGAGQAK